MGCAFCCSATDPLLVDNDDDGLILVDRLPLCRGHLLVVTREHVPSSADLPSAARRRFQARVRAACGVSAAITGRTAIAVEHGRSPTCGDPSCSCHAHVHIAPVGSFEDEDLPRFGLRPSSPPLRHMPFLALAEAGNRWRYFIPGTPTLHVARTVAALIAETNGVAWRPMAAPHTFEEAKQTADLARKAVAPKPNASRVTEVRRLRSSRRRSVAVVSGPTGSGKTTVGSYLAKQLEVPAVELGVLVRLACLHISSSSDRKIASTLFRWRSARRLDFHGEGAYGLAAALPRLDGGTAEVPMWTDVETRRLSEMAQSDRVQEALACVASAIAAEEGAVIIGRLPLTIEGLHVTRIELDAAPAERARRKRKQLAALQLGVDAHDWFVPRLLVPSDAPRAVRDTTRFTIDEMCHVMLQDCLAGDWVAALRL